MKTLAKICGVLALLVVSQAHAGELVVIVNDFAKQFNQPQNAGRLIGAELVDAGKIRLQRCRNAVA